MVLSHNILCHRHRDIISPPSVDIDDDAAPPKGRTAPPCTTPSTLFPVSPAAMPYGRGLSSEDEFPPLLPVNHGLSGRPPCIPHPPTNTHTDTTVVGTATLVTDLVATLQQRQKDAAERQKDAAERHQLMMADAAERMADAAERRHQSMMALLEHLALLLAPTQQPSTAAAPSPPLPPPAASIPSPILSPSPKLDTPAHPTVYHPYHGVIFVNDSAPPFPNQPTPPRLRALPLLKTAHRRRHRKHRLSLHERGQDGRSEKALMLAPHHDTVGPTPTYRSPTLSKGVYTVPFCLPSPLNQPTPSWQRALRLPKPPRRRRHRKHRLSLNERGQDNRSAKALMLAPLHDNNIGEAATQ